MKCVQSISLSAGAPEARPHPVFDLAFNPEDIKARLSGVPVYTVANKKNEFVLVAGEVCDQRPKPCTATIFTYLR